MKNKVKTLKKDFLICLLTNEKMANQSRAIYLLIPFFAVLFQYFLTSFVVLFLLMSINYLEYGVISLLSTLSLLKKELIAFLVLFGIYSVIRTVSLYWRLSKIMKHESITLNGFKRMEMSAKLELVERVKNKVNKEKLKKDTHETN